jgi:two-component system, OmpR family, sensor histidine kinase KdpD
MPDTARPRRGALRVYLGAAPGVGKTFAMLAEGRRRAERGTDVVVGLVETHGRARTAEQIVGLEVVPRRQVTHRGATFEEMDVDAVLARQPEVALVDELAHTNVGDGRHRKRWEDIDELLDAGIDVVTTVNIQHLESVNDVVERITGAAQRETVPDQVVRAADQVELVDMTPEALRRRMAHGNVYPAERIDAALGNYFRAGNLTALRELALLWVADQVDVGLEEYRRRHGITEPWETRERVVVALTGAPAGEALIRRAARIARRAHGELLGVHVTSAEGLSGPPPGDIERHRALLVDLGGEYHEVTGAEVAAALVDFAHAENATQIVLGSSERSRWDELVRGSVINTVIRRSGAIDVHVISHARPAGERPGGNRRRTRPSPLTRRRLAGGWLLTVAGVALLTLGLVQLRGDVGLPTVLLTYLALVVTVAAVGGTAPAVAAALAASAAANWFFTPPYYTWTIARAENFVALGVFLGVALVVSAFVDMAARRTTEAARARDQARNLARLAASLGDDDPLPALLDHVRSVFGMDGAAVLREDDGGWRVEARSGGRAPTRPQDAAVVSELAPGMALALAGPPIAAEDQLVLNAFAAQLATVVEHGRLRAENAQAQALAEANALRSALLQAVSHDLRTPLAAIKASASSLADAQVDWSPDDVVAFASTIDEQTDRLTALVANLLDMSRIQAGVVTPTSRPIGLEEVVPGAVAWLGLPDDAVDIDLPATVPPVLADAQLLERVVANLVDNAARFAPPGRPVRVEAGAVGERVDLRIVDEGPGIPADARKNAFQPFQRLGDQPAGSGVGLGLAVAQGFVTAMGGTIEVDDTPGGGTTFVVSLPAGPAPAG